MAFVINPFTGKLDEIRSAFASGGYIMSDGTNRWTITINTSGALVSTIIGAPASTAGTPMGLLVALTYSS